MARQEGSDESQAVAELFAEEPERWPEAAGYDAKVHSLHVKHLPDLAVKLAEIGFSNSEITGILGGNFRRVAEIVWK